MPPFISLYDPTAGSSTTTPLTAGTGLQITNNIITLTDTIPTTVNTTASHPGYTAYTANGYASGHGSLNSPDPKFTIIKPQNQPAELQYTQGLDIVCTVGDDIHTLLTEAATTNLTAHNLELRFTGADPGDFFKLNITGFANADPNPILHTADTRATFLLDGVLTTFEGEDSLTAGPYTVTGEISYAGLPATIPSITLAKPFAALTNTLPSLATSLVPNGTELIAALDAGATIPDLTINSANRLLIAADDTYTFEVKGQFDLAGASDFYPPMGVSLAIIPPGSTVVTRHTNAPGIGYTGTSNDDKPIIYRFNVLNLPLTAGTQIAVRTYTDPDHTVASGIGKTNFECALKMWAEFINIS